MLKSLFGCMCLNRLNPFFQRQRQAASERRGMSREKFCELYIAYGERAVLFAGALWSELQAYSVETPYGVHPDDSLLELYGITDDELEFIVNSLLRSDEMKLASPKSAELPFRTIGTIGELMEAFADWEARSGTLKGRNGVLPKE